MDRRGARGETPEGGPWDGSEPDTFATLGRAWPILAGERVFIRLARSMDDECSAGQPDAVRRPR